MFFNRYFIIGVALLGLLGISVFAANPLEKTEWRVEITPQGGTVPHFIDRVRFEDGNLSSSIFERKGFAATPYKQSEKGDALTWKTEQKSKFGGDTAWEGELKGEALTGTLVWKNPDGKTTQYTLNGRPVTEEELAAAGGQVTSATKAAEAAKSAWGCSLVPSPQN